MTGFGSGRARVGDEEVVVEVRAVNHKFCDVKVRMPAELGLLEPEIVRLVKEVVHRGALEVGVRRSSSGRSGLVPRLDVELAREYVAALDRLAGDLGVARNLGVAELAQIEGVVSLEPRGADPEALRGAVGEALRLALESLSAMREREGAAIAGDLRARVGALGEQARRLGALAPASVAVYRDQLERRVQELARNVPVDPQRMAQEVAIFAERADVAEELTRLGSHLAQLERMVEATGPVGRKMDFLVQEINREINTTGAKSQDAEMARTVVEMKAELERIREQVQNVE